VPRNCRNVLSPRAASRSWNTTLSWGEQREFGIFDLKSAGADQRRSARPGLQDAAPKGRHQRLRGKRKQQFGADLDALLERRIILDVAIRNGKIICSRWPLERGHRPPPPPGCADYDAKRSHVDSRKRGFPRFLKTWMARIRQRNNPVSLPHQMQKGEQARAGCETSSVRTRRARSHKACSSIDTAPRRVTSEPPPFAVVARETRASQAAPEKGLAVSDGEPRRPKRRKTGEGRSKRGATILAPAGPDKEIKKMPTAREIGQQSCLSLLPKP